MTPFTARCLLVGASLVTAGAGVLAPLSGPSRVALFAAAGCCAAIDVLLVRATRAAGPGADGVVDVVVRAGGPVAETPSATGSSLSSAVVLGTTDEGLEIGVGERRPLHIAIVGTGVLAVAVFRALAAQVRAGAAASNAPVRVASAPELRSLVAIGVEPCPRMPDDTAALVSGVGTDDLTTVVLVAAHGQAPRRWDVLVEVTRYGCSVRRRDERVGVAVSPVLPELAPEPDP